MKLELFWKDLDVVMTKTAQVTGCAVDDLRPFVCAGSPLECQVFIVGFNPATSQVPWRHFWDNDWGFDKARWLEVYREERVKRGKRPLSATRRRIEQLVAALAPYRCLETNLYARSTPSADQLAQADRVTFIFEHLLDSIKPKVVYLHGSDTLKAFQRLSNRWSGSLQLEKSKLIPFHSGFLYATNHLSRISNQTLAETIDVLRSVHFPRSAGS